MPTQIAHLQRRPYSPIASAALRSNNKIILCPPSNAVSVANSQAFSSLAGNSVALANPSLTNPILLNGSGLFSVIDPSASDKSVYVPIPFCPVITFSDGTKTATFRWTGIDHLGRPIRLTEQKTNVATVATFFQSQAAFGLIDTLEVLAYNGAAGDTFTVGCVYDWGASAGNGYFRRFPLPYEIQANTQHVGASVVELGGATWAGVTAWAIGDTISPTTSADRDGYTFSASLGTALFNAGRTSVNPTTTFRLVISQLPYARNSYYRDSVPSIEKAV